MMIFPVTSFIVLTQAQTSDKFASTFEAIQKADKSSLSRLKLSDSWQAAKAKEASLEKRFRFGALTVCAFDKKALSRSDSKFYSQEASKLFTIDDLKSSPMCGYVIARLGLIHRQITDLEVAGAKKYYDAKHSGVGANVYARTLVGHSDQATRAKALQYALEAQSKQLDSVKIRWMVGGAYFEKAWFTKEKQYWQAAIKEYEKALEIAKSGKDKDFSEDNLETIRFYLKRAKEEVKKATG
jgi:tetratricopeptide (TPR) repeat protein